MPQNQRKIGEAASPIIRQLPLACSNEQAAIEFFERMRWRECPACPRCGDTDVYQMQDRKTGERNSRFLWRCRGCRKQFTVRIGTVLEDSPIPLRYWAFAFWASCSSKKGASALQIQRQTGLSYKSALFMMHRIRLAMAPTSNGPKLDGTVEIDETYFGGKPRYRKSTNPHGTHGKQAENAPSLQSRGQNETADL
jgi:transposase-like protein